MRKAKKPTQARRKPAAPAKAKFTPNKRDIDVTRLVLAVAWTQQRCLGLGAWCRRRAGTLLVGSSLVVAVYSPVLLDAQIRPTLTENCESNEYISRLVSVYGCHDREICNARALAFAASLEIATETAQRGCDVPPPVPFHVPIVRQLSAWHRERRAYIDAHTPPFRPEPVDPETTPTIQLTESTTP